MTVRTDRSDHSRYSSAYATGRERIIVRNGASASRDPSIELFRCVCMFGVCLLHALDLGGYADTHRGLDNLVTSSVVGFVFVSGWFGIRFKLSRVVKLLAISMYCSLVVALAYDLGFLGVRDVGSLGAAFWTRIKGAWFLWCYLSLMIVAPVLEPLFEVEDRISILRRVVPVIFLAFGWSYAATVVPIWKSYAPNVSGFGAFSLLTFVGIYLAARTCRMFKVDQCVSLRALLFTAVLSGAACWIGFKHYHSPTALLFAGSMFLLFKRMSIGNAAVCRFILMCSPSMFSVYLIHNTSMGMAWMHYVEDGLIGGQGQNYGSWEQCEKWVDAG